jgi:YHS domain-containing protein
MKKQIQIYGPLFLATAFLAISGASCASSPTSEKPYDSVVVDRSNPQKTIVEFNGACAAGVEQGKYDVQGSKEYSVTSGGKTYYFSSASARDQFMDNFAENSKKADQMWLTRSEIETGSGSNTAVR